jgi:hypothetical protein
MVSLAAAIGLSVLALSAPPAAPAGLPGTGLVRVTAGSPLPAGCEARGAQRGSEVEPSIAASPRDPGLLIAVWQQDRYLRAAAAGIGVSVSRDGGASWTAASVPGITDCTPQTNHASDPWVSFGGDGTAYVAALVGQPDRVGFRTRVAVATTRDGGASWSPPALLDAGGNGFNDKPAVTADPRRAGTAYAVWDLEASVYMSITRDGGATWSPPREIRRRPPGGGSVASTISVLADGSLLHSFLAYGPGGLRLAAARSPDGGASWSAPAVVARVPRGGSVLRSGRPAVRVLPVSGTGPAVTASGAVYAAFLDSGVSIDLVRSTDGGRSWTRPRASIRSTAGVFGPALAAAPDGTLALSYYAREPAGTASFWIARSADGATWTPRRVTAPFSLRLAPRSDGIAFLGDYSGLTATAGGGFAAAFAAAPPLAASGGSDVLVAPAGG